MPRRSVARMAREVDHNLASDYTSPMPPLEPTISGDLEDLEIQARTMAAEHEAAEKAKTRVFVETEGAPGTKGLPATLALPSPYADKGEVARGGMGSVRR